MIPLSPLHLKRAAEALLVANTPSYVVNNLMSSDYPQTLAARHMPAELAATFSNAMSRSDFEENDDVVMILMLLALAVRGDFKTIEDLPSPENPPRFYSEVKSILPQLFPKTRVEKVSINPSVVEHLKSERTNASHQRLTLGGLP